MINKATWILLVCFPILAVIVFTDGRISSPSFSGKAQSKMDAIVICDGVSAYYKELGDRPSLDIKFADVLSGGNLRKIVFIKGVLRNSDGDYVDRDGHPFRIRIIDRQVIVFDSNNKRIASRSLDAEQK